MGREQQLSSGLVGGVFDAASAYEALERSIKDIRTKLPGNLPIDFLHWREAQADILPADYIWLHQNTDFSVSDNALVTIPWSDSSAAPTVPSGSGTLRRYGGFGWSSLNTSRIEIQERLPGEVYITVGQIVWAGNSSGKRTVTLEWYSSANVIQSGLTLTQIEPVGSTSIVTAWGDASRVDPALASVSYGLFRVLQDSGGPITVTNARAAILRIH